MLRVKNNSKTIQEAVGIFQQPWWLNTVAPGAWDAAEVIVGNEIRARLPYVIKRFPLGLKLLTMPKLTPYLGPWLAPNKAKYAKKLGQQKDLLNALLDQLPPYDYFRHKFHYTVPNWMPFYWRGFSSSTYYTYVIENLNDVDQIWDGFLDNIRTDISSVRQGICIKGLDASPHIEQEQLGRWCFSPGTEHFPETATLHQPGLHQAGEFQ